MLFVAFAAFAAAVPSAHAQVSIGIANASFEQDVLTPGTVFTAGNPVTGWTRMNDGGSQGILAPNALDTDNFYPGPTTGFDGNQIEFHWDGSGGIEQVLADRLLANTRYTLTVASGTRNGNASGSFTGYDIRLLTESGQLLGSWLGASRNLAAPGTFADTSRSFETGPAPLGLGERLRVQLRGASNGGYADLDNVRLIATPIAARAVTVPIDVFIVSGQSNAHGWTTSTASLSTANRHYADTPDTRALLGYRQRVLADALDSVGSMGQLDTQGSGFAYNVDGFGPELALGSDYAASANKRVAIIKYAVGSAGLAQNFLKTGATGEALYAPMSQHIQLMLAQLRQQGYAPNLRAVFWLQGETDALYGTGASYAANMQRFIADVRADNQAPNLQFYLTQINPNMPSLTGPGTAEVNNGMMAAASNDPSRVFFIPTDDIRSGFADSIHYSSDQEIMIGQRWAARYISQNP